MSDQVCIRNKKELCAESFCDLWNLTEKKCNIAVEIESRIETQKELKKLLKAKREALQKGKKPKHFIGINRIDEEKSSVH